VPRTDIEHYPSAVASLARVMQHLGRSCTFRSDGLVAENYGYYAGGKQWQREISLRLIDQAIACKAKILLVPECGHAYAALRWEAAELYGKPLPFKVLQVTEFLADELEAGRLNWAPRSPARPRFRIPASRCEKAASRRRRGCS
jgi:Fe-S oxidoreductase